MLDLPPCRSVCCQNQQLKMRKSNLSVPVAHVRPLRVHTLHVRGLTYIERVHVMDGISFQMATCHTCNKTSRHKGMNRDFIATLAKTHSTPGSAGKHKTPQSTSRPFMTTPKTPGKDKTPIHTPRPTASTNTPGSGSSSSKPPSKGKNWVVQRLSKILMREDNQSNKKGGLKDFLSSL
ncbi:hypothetical protein PAMA_011453 [Pampus argenteus]